MNLPSVLKTAFKSTSILRTRDFEKYGILRRELCQFVKEGALRKVGRGMYALPTAKVGKDHTLAEVATRVPKGVICLLSALRFHGLTTQQPREVWIALANHARTPKTDCFSLHPVYFSEAALLEGKEEHNIEGVIVKVYNPAKTVADCFKYRNKIGIDIALEALREILHTRRYTISDLMYYARICRVANVMMPYLKAFVV